MTGRNKHRGAISELRATTFLLEQGFEVFRNISQHGSIDIIAISKDGTLLKIDVKTASSKTYTRVIDGQIIEDFSFLPLSKAQISAGIIPLYIMPDGSVRWEPIVKPFRVIAGGAFNKSILRHEPNPKFIGNSGEG